MPEQQPAGARPAKAHQPTPKPERPAPQAGSANWQRGAAAPEAASPEAIRSLQRRFGNRAVTGLLQAKRANGPARGATPPLVRASTAATHTAARLVQRKSALVGAKTTTRKFKGPRTDSPDNDIQAVDDAPKGQSFDRLESIDVYDGQQAHINDKSGTVAWYRIQRGKGAGEFIRGTKVIGGLGPGATAPEQAAVKENDVSFLDAGNVGMGNIDNNLLDYTRQVTVEQGSAAATNLNLAEGGTWMAAGILGMAVSLRDLADDEKSAWDKVNAAIGLVSGAVSVAGATSQIIGNATQSGSAVSNTANSTSAWLLSYGDMFNGILNGIRLIRNVIELVKMVAGNERYNTGKGVQLGTEILGAALDTGRNVLRSIRLVNEAISGSVGTQFNQLVPGLDIAIAAVKSIQQGYYLIVSAIHMQRMYQRKMELEAKLRNEVAVDEEVEGPAAGRAFTQEEIKEAGKRHRTEEAQAVTFSQLIKRTDDKIQKTTAEHNEMTGKIFNAGDDRQRAALVQKRDALKARLDQLRQKMTQLEQGQTELNTRMQAGETGGGPTRADLQERELASDTHIANKRRVTRQATHISTNLMQIAGSIAAIVSGPGAPAAIAVKLAAAGVDTSLPLFRWMKQKGRDMAARNAAKGQSGLANKIFNADKATAAKQRARHKTAVVILQMVGRLTRLMPTQAEQAEARTSKLATLRQRVKYVEDYIRATGCPPEKLYAANGKPDEQVKLLVEELSKREL